MAIKPRHADVVMFSFRVIEVPKDPNRFHDLVNALGENLEDSKVILRALKVIGQDQYTMTIQRGQIHDLERYWTDIKTENSYESSMVPSPEHSVRILLLFRTFCQPEDWQLKRELYCVIWSRQTVSLLSKFLGENADASFEKDHQSPMQHSKLIRAFQQLRNLSGRHSVVYVLDNTYFMLLSSNEPSGGEDPLRWCPPKSQNVPEHAFERCVMWFDFASSDEIFRRTYYHQENKLLWLIPTLPAAGTPADLVEIPDDVGSGGAMLVLKPRGWPQHCPRFCAFVLDRGSQGAARLGHLLGYTIQMRDMFHVCEANGEEPEVLSAADIQLLKIWKDSFRQPAMERA